MNQAVKERSTNTYLLEKYRRMVNVKGSTTSRRQSPKTEVVKAKIKLLKSTGRLEADVLQ